jgi:sialic acid synthase SpsE
MKKINIIAELCQNHLGKRSLLKEMVHAAKESGANFVKIQSMRSLDLNIRSRFDSGLIEGNEEKVIKRPYKAEFKRLKQLDLSVEDHFYFLDLCKKYKINPITTIFTRNRIELIKELNLNYIKISSFDCSSHAMLKELKKKVKSEFIVSTGATYDSEINKTADILGKNKFIILHCVSNYPTTPEFACLSRINFLKKFSNKVGFSDHTNADLHESDLSLIAILQGATWIERHFTILDKKKTKDGIISVNKEQLVKLVNMANSSKEEIKSYINKKYSKTMLKTILGKPTREFSKKEILNRDYYRGRFVSRTRNNKIVYNSDETINYNEIIQV